MSNTLVEIAGRKIAKSFSPTIVAEMSGNHNHSLDRALALVEAASNSGAHALKLQTYTADTITLDVSQGEFNINDEKNLWNGNNLYKLYQQAYTLGVAQADHAASHRTGHVLFPVLRRRKCG